VALVTGDLSFISLVAVLPALMGLVAPGGSLVLLVKPQFEAERSEVSRGQGVISDPSIWRRAVVGVDAALASAGASMMGVMPSPIRGAQGNVEFLVHAVLGAPGSHADAEALIERAVDEAARPADEDGPS
jgi:23S rRNA (cytidine1920-2'-O)/16S rRNA (cytidine1409-2'-O)-methyltransferase